MCDIKVDGGKVLGANRSYCGREVLVNLVEVVEDSR